jgi:hypothetical protein
MIKHSRRIGRVGGKLVYRRIEIVLRRTSRPNVKHANRVSTDYRVRSHRVSLQNYAAGYLPKAPFAIANGMKTSCWCMTWIESNTEFRGMESQIN